MERALVAIPMTALTSFSTSLDSAPIRPQSDSKSIGKQESYNNRCPETGSALSTPRFLHISVVLSFSPFLLIRMIEVILNDRLGRKIRVKCNPSDTVGDLKKLVAAQTGIVAVVSLTPRHASGENPNSEVVHHVQGPHHARGLRNPRRNGSGTVL